MQTRRDFLQKLGASAAGLPLLPYLSEQAGAAPYDGPVLRVAIKGLGGGYAGL